MQVHGDHGAGARGDGCFQEHGVHPHGCRLDVDEDRDRPGVQHGQGGGDESECWDDDFVPRPDAGRGEGEVKRRRSTVGGQAIL